MKMPEFGFNCPLPLRQQKTKPNTLLASLCIHENSRLQGQMWQNL